MFQTSTRYGTSDVSRRTGATLRQLQTWDENGIVSPQHGRHRRQYTALEVLHVGLIAGLRNRGLSLQKLKPLVGRKCMDLVALRIASSPEGAKTYMLVQVQPTSQVFFATGPVELAEITVKNPGVTTLCVSDLCEKLDLDMPRRKSVKSATTSTGRAKSGSAGAPRVAGMRNRKR